MTTMTYETGEYLDAEQFEAWLYETMPELHEHATAMIGETGMRAIRVARKKGHIGLDAADKICVVLDLHLRECPDDIWIDPPKRKKVGGKRRKWEQLRAREMAEEGFYTAEIARILNVTRQSVWNWTKDMP